MSETLLYADEVQSALLNELRPLNKRMNNKTKLVPELRFPEFRDEVAWKIEPLGVLSKEITEKTKGRKYQLMSITSGVGLVSQLEKFGREIAGNSYDNYYVIYPSDFAYNKSSTKLYGEGEVAIYEGKEIGAVPNSIFTCFRFDKSIINPAFAKYPFVNNIHGKWLRQFIAIGARANGALQVNVKDLFSMPFPFPGLPEQQKIASCLSSLDEVIVTNTQKLETLKEHQKGLMQNLFPQEGETVPKYRFPEFLEDGEWAVKTVEQIAKVTTGNKDTQNKVENGEYPFFVRSQSVERINSYSFDGEAILTSGDGVGVGKNFHFINGKFDFHQRVYCIYDFSKNVVGHFIFMYFSKHFGGRVLRMSAKNSVDSVRMSMITEMPIGLPSKKEQQKIALCLSTLDQLIAAQIKKLDELRSYKNGLMQVLFPKATNEI